MRRVPFCLLSAIVLFFSNCASLPKDVDRPVSHALTETQDTQLGEFVEERQEGDSEQSGFYLLGKGLDAFVARAVLARKAERSLDVQYYLYHKDLVGWLFTYELLQAADRGVRVRILVDDMDLAGRDPGVAATDSHPNVEVRIFNPFSRETGRTSQFITRMGSVTRRMHNKSFTADNQITILGGRNIGNEYFQADPDLEFADLDVMCVGPVAMDVSSVFDRYWNSELAYPVAELLKDDPPTPEKVGQLRGELEQYVAEKQNSPYLEALQNSDLADKMRKDQVEFRWGKSKIVYDQPEKLLHKFEETEYHLAPMLRPYWQNVKKDLIIFSPYFVPGKKGTAFLTQLARRGVRVRILTNSLASNDVGLVHAGYKKYRRKLLRAGVELYELNKKLTREQRKKAKESPVGSSMASLHAKSFVFDRKQVFIGSLNLDPRALLHNTEIGVILTVPEIAEEMVAWFEENVPRIAFKLELKKNEEGFELLYWHGYENEQKVVYTHEPHTGFFRRLGIGFMSWWPIESQL